MYISPYQKSVATECSRLGLWYAPDGLGVMIFFTLVGPIERRRSLPITWAPSAQSVWYFSAMIGVTYVVLHYAWPTWFGLLAFF